MSISKVGRLGAMQAALARAQRHAGTAAVAAVLTPLAMVGLTTPAQALVQAPAPLTNVSISGSATTSGAVTTFTYTVTNNALARSGTQNTSLDNFEIPEIAAGDFNLSSFLGPTGWTATPEQRFTLTNTSLKNGTLPGAYILVSAPFYLGGIHIGQSGTFSLTTTESGTLPANFGVTVLASDFQNNIVVNERGYIDPPVPGGPAAVTGVLEPASIAILGWAVLLTGATRMRRKN